MLCESRWDKITDWLINETRTERYIDDILVQLGEKLRKVDIPVARITLHFWTNHPQWLGARLMWKAGMSEAEIERFGYETQNTPQFLQSPAFEILNGSPIVRQRLAGDDLEDKYPLYAELRAEGYSDYVAWPLDHTLGKRHLVTFATDADGGFDEGWIRLLGRLVPVLALVTEIRIKNILARTLLETYVGPHASEKILSGVTRRGSGATLRAAIMICDLRDFTEISNLWPRDDVIEMLNGYFDAVSGPIEENGGEILKFMGDGLLAVFPLSDQTAPHRLLKAVAEAKLNMAALNETHRHKNRPLLRCGMGVHVGDIMYGNIGSKTRLDFTAIGPAVNVAGRLEALTKAVGRPVLMSEAFVKLSGDGAEFDNLGNYELKGLNEPVAVYALSEELSRQRPELLVAGL